MIDINLALLIIVGILAFAIIYTLFKEKKARRYDIDFACGFVGTSNTPEEMLRIREEARQYMESRGFRFDYSKAKAHNEALEQKKEEEREEARIRLLAAYAQQQREKDWKKEGVIQLAERRKEITLPAHLTESSERERGVSVLYPRGSNKHVPPKPTRPRKRVKKRDGTSTYQLGQDISPVWGIKKHSSAMPDKTMQNTHRQAPVQAYEDDYPPNPEQAYKKALSVHDDTKTEKHKQEILSRPYTVQDYKKNYDDYEELRKKLLA